MYNITTLTPVSIGNGNKLSPFADYVLHKDEIYYINQDVIKDKMRDKPELIDIYVQGMISGKTHNSNAFSLYDFVLNDLKLSLKDASWNTVEAQKVRGKKDLYSIVKNAGQSPYIPGSTLKGAIKTALLYDWLISDEKGEQWCDCFLNDFKNPQLIKELEQEFDKFELSVSDSSLFKFDSVKVVDIKRFHLKKGTLDIPQTWETIREGVEGQIEIRTPKKILNVQPDGTKEYKYYSWAELCTIINTFSDYSSDAEWTILSLLGEKYDKITDKLYFPLEDFYGKIEESTKSKETALLRIGSGKGFYFNSIALALFDRDNTKKKEKFLSFLKGNGYGKVYNKQTKKMETYDLHPEEFPLTRFVEEENITPLGWVKIEQNNFTKIITT